MTMTDPIADMLTRIRNALAAGARDVTMPSSAMKLRVAEVLKREGFIESFEIVPKDIQNDMKVVLKYGPNGEKVITEIKRVSKPGKRVYRSYKDLRPVLRGLGIVVLSTSQGVMSDREARQAKLGGEVLCQVQ